MEGARPRAPQAFLQAFLRRTRTCALHLALLPLALFANPFSATLVPDGILLHVPDGYFLYADSITITQDETPVAFTFDPAPIDYDDALFGITAILRADTTLIFDNTGALLTLTYQGCSDDGLCLLPQTVMFGSAPPMFQPSAIGHQPFSIARRATGFLSATEMLAFLADPDSAPKSRYRLFLDSPVAFFNQHGLLWLILFALAGGFLLNLSPCILPLLPVNLALIGVGANNTSRGRGFLLGGAYGLGTALAYGSLGVVALFTGSVFGSLQSSPWFNLGIALLFILLGLALVGVINIDFTRFQKNAAPTQTFFAAFVAGAVSALLAGACVAPVIVAVLLLAASLFHDGMTIALFLPLLLGIGMALPWPFAGAGLTLLPRPGAWMRFVKIPFVAFLLLLALNYAYASWQGFRPATIGESIQPADFRAELARAEGRPVFVDVWATWCRNCLLMERATFRNPQVRERLNDFHVIKLQAENTFEPVAAELLRQLGVSGLPTFLILNPEP